MPRHQPIILTGDELEQTITNETDKWAAVFEMIGGEPAGPDLWLVRWPEHVAVDKFNPDAIYARINNQDAKTMIDAGEASPLEDR